jgi:HD domain/PAS fold
MLERIFAGINMAIAYVDRSLSFIRVNRTFADAAGHPSAWFAGRCLGDLTGISDLAAICGAVSASGQPYSVTEGHFPGLGTERWWDWTLQPVDGDDGITEGLVLWLTDVSERVRERAELHRTQERLSKALDDVVLAAASALERRDPYTAGHQHRVASLVATLGCRLGMDGNEIKGMTTAAVIHDIGKVSVPAEILARPGRLSAPEFELIKGHPQVGWEIVKDIDFPWPIANMILQHHEKLDGSGYPAGLVGDAILPGARIITVADVVEAMASHRPYRPGLGMAAALAEIQAGSGRHYDPIVVDACVQTFADGFSFAD